MSLCNINSNKIGKTNPKLLNVPYLQNSQELTLFTQLSYLLQNCSSTKKVKATI